MSWWIIAALTAYYIKGLCGFANTLIFTSILSFGNANVNISPTDLLLGYSSNVIMVWKERKYIRWQICLPLIAMVLIGSIPGIFFLKNVDTGAIKILFGVVIIFIGIEMLWREYRPRKGKQSKLVLLVIGLVSGILCGLYGIGALLSSYVSRVTEDTHSFKANMCTVFLAESTFRIVLYTAWGILTPAIAKQALILIPFMLIGLFLGMKSCSFLNEKLVKKIVIVMLIVSGAALIINSL